MIGGARWAIHSSPDASAALIAAIGGCPQGDGQQADVRIDVWTACAPLTSDPDAVLSHRAGGFTTHVTPLGTYLFDEESSTGSLMLQKGTGVKAILGTNVLFPVIAWWARARGLVPLHAATLGVDGRYWLIPAASGSGKSVACVLGQAGGLQSLGDDVVLWDPASDTVHAVYETVRVTADGLRLVAAYLNRAGLRHEGFRHDGKALLVSQRPRPRIGSLAGILMIGEREATSAAAHRRMLSTLPMLVWSGIDPHPVSGELARLARGARRRTVQRCPDLDEWAHTLSQVCHD